MLLPWAFGAVAIGAVGIPFIFVAGPFILLLAAAYLIIYLAYASRQREIDLVYGPSPFSIFLGLMTLIGLILVSAWFTVKVVISALGPISFA